MTARIGVCDYGVGNMRSVERALASAGATVVVSDDANVIAGCDGAVLPGVGAFAPAARLLRDRGLDAAITELARRRMPILGVCLGFQLLFEHSTEGEGGDGLGLLRGEIERLVAPGLKVPHMGWNRLDMVRPSPLLNGLEPGAYVYFVHSYAANTDPEDVVATADHGGVVVAACHHGAVMGTQFHPEKSGPAGLRIYANFAAACGAGR
ncbi:MAG: imidazole glycerol phosphate synthase subunit HisH [Candidatus Dormibacteria bacterium]